MFRFSTFNNRFYKNNNIKQRNNRLNIPMVFFYMKNLVNTKFYNDAM